MRAYVDQMYLPPQSNHEMPMRTHPALAAHTRHNLLMSVGVRRNPREAMLTEQELQQLLHPDAADAQQRLAAREAARQVFAQQNAAFKVSGMHQIAHSLQDICQQ